LFFNESSGFVLGLSSSFRTTLVSSPTNSEESGNIFFLSFSEEKKMETRYSYLSFQRAGEPAVNSASPAAVGASKFCSQCGVNVTGARFCGQCGEKVN